MKHTFPIDSKLWADIDRNLNRALKDSKELIPLLLKAIAKTGVLTDCASWAAEAKTISAAKRYRETLLDAAQHWLLFAVSLGKPAKEVIDAIVAERDRQDAKWGVVDHTPDIWMVILGEEVGEVCQAVCKSSISPKEDSSWFPRIYEETVQVLAVCQAAWECGKRTKLWELES